MTNGGRFALTAPLSRASETRGRFVDPRAGRHVADELLVVQEHQLLDEGDRPVGNLAGLGSQGVLEEGGEVLGLAAGEQQGGVLGAVAVPHPDAVVAGEDAAVVLELDQVERVAGQDQQVDLMPAAAVVAELEVRPGPKWGGD